MNLSDLNQDDDVVHLTDKQCSLVAGNPNLFVGKLMELVQASLEKSSLKSFREDTGLECRILQSEKPKWQKGKLVLRLEFIPDPDEIPDTKEIDQPRW
jgi:hypothetical protein